MIMSRDQNIVRNGNIKIGDSSFEEVEKFKYLGATVTNINDTLEEIKRRINMGNACYYSVEKLLSSSLLSKNLKVRIYKTVILPVLLYGCETWTLTLREEHRFRVFENKVLRKIFGAKRDEVTGEWRKLHNIELHALYSSPDIIRNIKSRRLRWAGHLARYLASERDEGDNAGEMSPGFSTESYPAFAYIGLRENPWKNLNQSVEQILIKECKVRRYLLTYLLTYWLLRPEVHCRPHISPPLVPILSKKEPLACTTLSGMRSLSKCDIVVVITEDVQNVHFLLEYRPHIDVSLTCEHDPKLQEYCVCPQNMPQFDSEGIPNQAPETNKPMILNGPTSRNREGSDQVSVEAKQLGHLYLSVDQETFDPSTGVPYD
ncbi:hypothetical protein ANN_19300 [Periplaneta americana]|uniref:Uncharacterized protein n=1 Tax=Periplaneta americana TaxID=6978 RepID=A0ABQ8S9H6_PERAM|nr:hypothetical protein ANN_19300 [Periplaneta americana]